MTCSDTADRRVVNDLNLVAVGIEQIERPGTVAMSPPLIDRHRSVARELRGPSIDIFGTAHHQTQVIKRRVPRSMLGG